MADRKNIVLSLQERAGITGVPSVEELAKTDIGLLLILRNVVQIPSFIERARELKKAHQERESKPVWERFFTPSIVPPIFMSDYLTLRFMERTLAPLDRLFPAQDLGPVIYNSEDNQWQVDGELLNDPVWESPHFPYAKEPFVRVNTRAKLHDPLGRDIDITYFRSYYQKNNGQPQKRSLLFCIDGNMDDRPHIYIDADDAIPGESYTLIPSERVSWQMVDAQTGRLLPLIERNEKTPPGHRVEYRGFGPFDYDPRSHS